jgi:hypothetical protein
LQRLVAGHLFVGCPAAPFRELSMTKPERGSTGHSRRGTRAPVVVTIPCVSFPDLNTAQCQSAVGATGLQVAATPTADELLPTVTAGLGHSGDDTSST